MITAKEAREIMDETLSKQITNETLDKIEQRIIECSQKIINSTRFEFDPICSATELDCIIKELRKCGYEVRIVYDKYIFPEYAEAIIIAW